MSDDLQYRVSLKDGVSSVLGKILGGFRSFGSGVKSVVGGAARMLTSLPALLTGGALSAFGGKSILDAMGVEEADSKFKAVFKSMAVEVEAWSTKFSAATQSSSYDVRDWLSTMQDTLVPMGLARGEAAKLSKQVVALSVDLGSFNNIPTADVLRDIQSATVGNHETMRKYGVVLTQANVTQQAVTMGLAKSTKNVSEQAKAMARLALIQAMTTDAQGDAVRTADSMSNSYKGMQAQFREFRVAIGAQLAAGLNLGEMFRTLSSRLKDWTARLRESKAVQKWAARVRQVVDVVVERFGLLRDRIAALGESNVGQTLAEGLREAGGMLLSLIRGATTLGTVLGDLGAVLGASLKVGLLGAVNVFARGLYAVVYGAVQTITGIPNVLTGIFITLMDPSLWSGLSQIVIGSLASVGAFVMKIFTAPLPLVQSGMDTIMKGMFNWLAGLGGDKDQFGVGRVGRALGLGLQDVTFDQELANAIARNPAYRFAVEMDAASGDEMVAGATKMTAALKPALTAITAPGQSFGEDIMDVYRSSKNLFDTSAAVGNLKDATANLGKYADAWEVPEFEATPAKPGGAPSKEGGSAGAPAAVDKASLKAAKDLAKMASENKTSSMDAAARQDWMRNVKGGRSPDEEIAENTRKMRELMEKLAKNEGVV